MLKAIVHVRYTFFVVECFEFEDENEINLKFLLVLSKKKDILESFIYLFFTKQVSTVIYTEGC